VVPSAKQQSFAAHNLADLAMVSFSDIPVSLANAFEEPVKALRAGDFSNLPLILSTAIGKTSIPDMD